MKSQELTNDKIEVQSSQGTITALVDSGSSQNLIHPSVVPFLKNTLVSKISAEQFPSSPNIRFTSLFLLMIIPPIQFARDRVKCEICVWHPVATVGNSISDASDMYWC
jgi:hypothetical protein